MMSLAVLSLAAFQMGAGVEEAYEEHVYVYTGGEYKEEPFKYRLMQPPKVEKGKSYPLVLFLHGAGERGDDNKSQLKYLPQYMAQAQYRSQFPCFVIAPQCRVEKRWVEADWSAENSMRMRPEPADQMKVAMGILDHVLENYPVDQQRIYLTGLSMGGYGSWELAMRRPGQFAAVAPICGGGDDSQAKLLVKVPIYAYHGDADQAVPVIRTRKMIAALEKAGGKPKYKELAGVGHNSWDAAYQDADGVVPWMFKQVNQRK